MKYFFRTALAALILPLSASAANVVDDFNDGNDGGWSRFSPFTQFGFPATFSFPNGNSYRLNAGASPNPGALRGARVGSFRSSDTYSDFYQAVDIVSWDATSGDMVMGMVARATNIGLGMTNGYISILETDGQLYIFRITGELPGEDPVAYGNLGALDTSKDYRMTFSASGSNFTTQVTNITDNITFAPIFGSDSAYGSGVSGVFVYDASEPANRIVDATFDNYVAVPEPASAGMLALGALGLLGRRCRKSTRA